MNCPNCGFELLPNDVFCGICGYKLEMNAAEAQTPPEPPAQAEIQWPQPEVQWPQPEVQWPQSEAQWPQSEVQWPQSEVQWPQSETQESQPEIQWPQADYGVPGSYYDSQPSVPAAQVYTQSSVDIMQTQSAAPAAEPAPKKKSRLAAILLIVLLLVAAGGGTLYYFYGESGEDSEPTQSVAGFAGLPGVTYSYLTAEKAIEVDYECISTVYPALYSTLDSLVNFAATCEGGETDVLVKVEIPGFTQPYEQKLTLTRQISQVFVKPALLTGDLGLGSSKDAQLNFSITDLESGKIIIQESKIIKIMSKYDFILWDDEFGASTDDNALAWLTPESEGVLNLKRNAIEWLTEYSDGAFTMLQGYQDSGLFGNLYYMNVYYQVLGIQGAMSDMGVRYNNSTFSLTEGYNQRVLLPDDVISSKSGVCMETALLMASALLAADMHVMLIFPPGHAQVAVETWSGSGEYFLIETTILPFEEGMEDYVITFLDADGWLDYLLDPWGDGGGSCYIVDCDMATTLGITALTN